jgi:hypothetical protein
MDTQDLRATMLQAILAQGIPLAQAIFDAEAAVAYVLSGPAAPAAPEPPKKKRKDAVLDLWADGRTATDIAGRLEMERMAVHKLIQRARNAGDPRAAMRHKKTSDARASDARRHNLVKARAKLASMRREAVSP